jgi:hypothetical protein
MRPRSTVWRAASLAETPIENLIWEIPLNSRCATEQGAPRKPQRALPQLLPRESSHRPLSRWPTLKKIHQQRTRSSSSIIGN